MCDLPKIYMQFEGRKELDGKRRKYWIQDATEELFDEIEYYLVEHFVGDEPATKYSHCHEDKVSLDDLRALWRNLLQEKLTIVCLTTDIANNVRLAGFNVLTVAKVNEKPNYELNGECAKKLFGTLRYAERQRDFHKEFNLKTCMKAMGLYVLTGFRGEGIGERLLDARELICRRMGITATITAFTSVISQKLAARTGFQDFYSIEYEKLGEIDPAMAIPDIQQHTKLFKFMYKLYK